MSLFNLRQYARYFDISFSIVFRRFNIFRGCHMVKGFVRGLIVFLLAAIFFVQGVYAEPAANSQQATGYTLEFPSSRYPETGAHIRDAIATGHSAVCTIDRDGAEENRKESLKG